MAIGRLVLKVFSKYISGKACPEGYKLKGLRCVKVEKKKTAIDKAIEGDVAWSQERNILKIFGEAIKRRRE